MTSPVIAALDTDVLVPVLVCDFLLTAFDLGLFDPVVSTSVLDEVERALLDDNPHLRPNSVRRRVEDMREALEDHLIDADEVEVPSGINVKDRHVAGAAIVGGAALLVSNDRALRAEVEHAVPGLHSLTADEFSTFLISRTSGAAVSDIVDAMVAKRVNPPVTRAAMLDVLCGALPTTVAALRRPDSS